MKRFLFGGSCLGMALLCMMSAFIIVLVGSVLFTQSQSKQTFPNTKPQVLTLTPAVKNDPSTTTPISVTNSDESDAEIGVTIEFQAQPTVTFDQSSSNTTPSDSELAPMATSTEVPFMTATPGNAPLGADIYELTITAEIVMNRTKGADDRQKLWATRTAVADESRSIFATLTTEAQLSPSPTGQ